MYILGEHQKCGLLFKHSNKVATIKKLEEKKW
jgi:hypothetical protein